MDSIKENYLIDQIDMLSVDIGCNSKQLQDVIFSRYNELHRHYHTCRHLYELYLLYNECKDLIHDHIAVQLSILFHDIIYDPQSTVNEDVSAEVWKEYIRSVSHDPVVNDALIEKVYKYILATKMHDCDDDNDDDLKYFLDMDMAILGTNRNVYIEYARNIRKEYIHVDGAVYCSKRPNVLQNFLTSKHSIYASMYFRDKYEVCARENLLYEINELMANNTLL